jgi:hypothetical protein
MERPADSPDPENRIWPSLKRFADGMDSVWDLRSVLLALICVILLIGFLRELIGSDPKRANEMMSGGVWFSGMLGAFLYFLDNWTIARLATSQQQLTGASGSPVQFCVMTSVGKTTCCLIGIHYWFFTFILQSHSVTRCALALVSYCVFYAEHWRILYSVLSWFDRYGNQTRGLSEVHVECLFDARSAFLRSVPCFVVFGLTGAWEAARGTTCGSIAIFATLFFGMFGVGGYTVFRDDYLPRAVSLTKR